MAAHCRFWLGLFLLVVAAGADWPRFRGEGGQGSGGESAPPQAFSASEHLAWRAALPGSGPSCPMVVGPTVVVTAASGPRQERLHVLAFDKESGALRWQRTCWATGPTLCASFGGVAGATPASDGRRIYALFSSSDLACLDLEGNLLWLRGLGMENPLTRNDVGMASSPVVAGDTVVVHLENPGNAWAAGIDAATGQTRWRLPLEPSACWTTPLVLPGKTPDADTVVLQTRSGLIALEPRSGRQLWKHEAGCSTISSSAGWEEGLIAPIDGLTALRCGPAGVEVAWQERRYRPENVSPLVHRGRVYTIKSAGVLVCGDAADGRVRWELRLKGPFWASPVAAGDLLYAVNHEGLVQTVRLGEEAGQLAGTGQIEAGVLATPAIADGALYLRTSQALWKIAPSPDN